MTIVTIGNSPATGICPECGSANTRVSYPNRANPGSDRWNMVKIKCRNCGKSWLYSGGKEGGEHMRDETLDEKPPWD